MKKNILKILLLFALVSFLPFLSGCGRKQSYDYETKKVVLEEVGKANMAKEMIFSATVEAKNQTSLSTKIPGKLQKIEADLGDEVKKGQILATLSGEENRSQERAAYSAYRNSLSILNSTEIQMEQNIENARAGLATAEENFKASLSASSNNKSVLVEKLKEARANLELARTLKRNLVDSFARKEDEIDKSLKTGIVQASILTNNILSYIYGLNHKSLPDKKNDFEIGERFVTKSSQAVNEAENIIISRFKPTVFELEEFYNQKIKEKNPDRETLFVGRNLAKKSLDEAKNALQAMKEVIFNSISYSEMSPEELSGYNDRLMNYGGQAESLLLSRENGEVSGLTGIDQALKNLKVERESRLRAADQEIELAVRRVELLFKSGDATDEDYESRVKIARAKLEEARQGLKTAETALQTQVKISESRADADRGFFDLAGIGVDNTRLIAPYDAVVVKKYLDEGSIIGAGTPVLEIADTSELKLIFYAPETSVKYFSPGKIGEAFVSEDDDKKYSAEVKRISPESELGSRKIKIEMNLLDFDKDYLNLGMEMKVKMNFEDDKKTVVVPLEAVDEFYGEKTVFVYKDGKAVRKTVKIGEVNEKFAEILSGVNENEAVIIAGINNLRQGDLVEVVEKELVKKE